MFIVRLSISYEQIPREEREPLGFFSLPADVGKRLEDVGSPVKFSCVCVWLIVSHFLTTCEEVLHLPLYTTRGPMSCEINLWRQLGQHGQQGALPGPGERNQ